MTAAWPAAIDALEPVSLEEINATAALQTRTDRKYLLPPETWSIALASLEAAPRVLEIDGQRRFRYESVYYDTPELDSYRDAARRRPQRFKVRTRHYLDTGARAVEVKLRSRTGETVKHRDWFDASASSWMGPGLPPQARGFVEAFPQTASAVDALSESLTTSYERVTLLLPDARVTVDSDVRGRNVRDEEVGFGRSLIVETKSVSRAGSVDRALWALGVRPAKVSKYCTALAALRPDLPSNRWTRTLRDHLTVPQPA
ncbi:polyphosphate polymerase domain-containing protein [uncultured Demequina sp.]|uniref:polyphosphate polymerase domain-containing protein n=1 Tax=uncultured Demequina sp. TaxID=693499 RepID=UPI0025D57CED|nr:polyphosphate polymerase domain-containing protein [uncultured Demequina sp.]